MNTNISLPARILRIFNRNVSALLAIIACCVPLGLFVLGYWYFSPTGTWRIMTILPGSVITLILQFLWMMYVHLCWEEAFPRSTADVHYSIKK